MAVLGQEISYPLSPSFPRKLMPGYVQVGHRNYVKLFFIDHRYCSIFSLQGMSILIDYAFWETQVLCYAMIFTSLGKYIKLIIFFEERRCDLEKLNYCEEYLCIWARNHNASLKLRKT